MDPIIDVEETDTQYLDLQSMTKDELLEILHLRGYCSAYMRHNPDAKNPWTDEPDSRKKEWAKTRCHTDCPVLEVCQTWRSKAYTMEREDRPISIVLAGTKYKSANAGYRKPRDRSKTA